MAFNPDISLNMLQREAAIRAFKQGTNLPPQMIPPQMMPPQQLPQMIGDSTGVSQMDPAFVAAVRQQVIGQGPEEQPEIPQPQAAPEAPQESSTAALMSGAADASRVAAMAHGGAVKGYADGGANSLMPLQMTGDSMGMSQIDPALLAAGRQEMIGQMPEEPNEILQRQIARFASKAMAYGGAVRGYADGEEVVSDNNITPLTGEIELLTKKLEDPNLSGFERTNAKYALQAAEIKFKNARELSSPKPTFGQSLKNLAPVKYFLKPSSIKENEELVNETKEKKEKYIKDNPLPSEKTIIPPLLVAAAPGPASPVAAPIVPVVAPKAPPVVNKNELKVSPDIANVLISTPPNIAQDVPKKKDYFKLLEEKLTENKSGISSQDKYMALLQASLGTMAAASQPGAKFLGSIGQGGMAGIKQIEDAQVLRAKERASDIDAYAKLAEIQQKTKEKVLSKGQEAIDTNYGKEYADFLSRGGAGVAAGQLKNLSDARNIITDAIANKKSITGPVASFVTSDNMPKWVGGFAAPETVTVQDMVNSVAQSNLRVTLGSQFAAKEGEGVLQRVFNPALSPQENLRRLDMMMSSIDSASKAKQAQAKFFKENDTLAGYEGPSVDDYLYELRDNLDKSDKNNLRKGKKPDSAPIEPGNYTFDPNTGGFTPQ
jgi:hypothetical protein